MKGTRKEPTQYGKLYKALGPETKNKDIRMGLTDEVNMYTDNQMSTNLHSNHIAGYTMDKHNQFGAMKD